MDIAQQVNLLKRGTVSLVSEEELAKKLSAGRKLRIKLGVDPTSRDLHLGHSVALSKLRAFQDLGHTAVLIIGDFTAMVGDPSGRDSTRPTLTPEEVKANAQTYQDQAFKILDKGKTELRFNSEWLHDFMANKLLDTLKRHTVQQILEREDFKARIRENSPLTMLETLYPLLQGYDSVAIKADVELGGNDQLTNLLMGRKMQKDLGFETQVALTVPLLVGLDGQKKMSKSYNNYIALNDAPNDVFGKVMKVSDELMLNYYELLTTEDLDAVKKLHPMEAKKSLAEKLTARFHGEEAGRAARQFFEDTFSKGQLPTDVETTVVDMSENAMKTFFSSYLVILAGLKSRKEAQRLLTEGAVSLDNVKVTRDELMHAVFQPRAGKQCVLKVGKHKFFRLNVPA